MQFAEYHQMTQEERQSVVAAARRCLHLSQQVSEQQHFYELGDELSQKSKVKSQNMTPDSRTGGFGNPPLPIPDSRLNNIRVLVVEDDRDTREFLALTLEEYGAQSIVVDSAVAALEALEKSLPDILVSDIGMPATDGYTFIQKVRALPPEQGGQIPAIALTAYAREQDRDRAIAAGFQIHLAKPVVSDELVEAIGQLISDQ